MAYKRKSTGRMVKSSRRGSKSSNSSYGKSSVSGFARRVRGRITLGSNAPEAKFSDELNSDNIVTGATQYTYGLMDAIAQGTTSSQRVGNKISVKSLDFKMNLQVSGTAPTPQVFWAVVLDKQPNAAIASFATIFTAQAAPNDNLVQRNYNNLDRFQVLAQGQVKPHEWLVTVQNGGTSTVACCHQNHFLPLNIDTRFADSTGQPQTNNLILCITGNGTTTANPISHSTYTRLRYADA